VIDKKQLAGILYYNAGVDASSKENFEEAYKDFEKAYFLYPSQKLRYFVMASLAGLVLEDKMKEDPAAYLYYLRFSEISNRDMARSLLKEYFETVCQKLLFKSSDPQKYQLTYKNIVSRVSDTAVKKDIRYIHYYNTAHYYDIKTKYDSSLLYLDSVFAYNKEDLLIQELITSNLLETVRSITDERKALNSLTEIFRRYPFVDRQGKLGEVYAYCLSQTASSAFQKDNKKEGDQYLEMIYGLIENQPELKKRSEPYFVAAFSESYSYYMGERKYKEARDFLTKVLKYYPDNEELQRRMKFVTKTLE